MSSVLLVDSDVEFGRSVTRQLEDHGHVVRLVQGAPQALDYLESADAGVMLTSLPLSGEMNGIDLIKQVWRDRPNVRNLVMGEFASEGEYRSALDAGVVAVLVKPFSSSELTMAINKAEECDAGFFGHVHGLNLPDLLQLYHFGRRAIRISLQLGGGQTGHIDMCDGDIVHARCGDSEGPQALQQLLAHVSGRIETDVLCSDLRTITGRFENVLMDAARCNDEGRRTIVAHADLPFELDLASEIESELEAAGTDSRALQLIARVRAADGYLGSCLAWRETGQVIVCDGSVDLSPVAEFAALAMRHLDQTHLNLSLLGQKPNALTVTTTQYHVIQHVELERPAFLHLVLQRDATNEATVQWAVSRALRACGF